MFSVLLHGSDQKVWQSLLVKSLQKNQITKKIQSLLRLRQNNMLFKVPSSSLLLLLMQLLVGVAGGGGGGGGSNDWVIPSTSEVFQMAFSMT